MMSNGNMPAMPLTPEMDDALDSTKSPERYRTGLTKRETFAMNAPAMPDWFEMVFINDDVLNKGVNYMQHNDETCEMWVGEEGRLAMFMAWPVYYANALLSQLEKAK